MFGYHKLQNYPFKWKENLEIKKKRKFSKIIENQKSHQIEKITN